MKAHYTEYLGEMLKSYSSDEKSVGRIQFIRCYSSFVASEKELKKQFLASKVECDFLYHEFDGGVIQSPYEPFIDWIKDEYSDKTDEDIEEMMNSAGVYSLHKPIIKNYIRSGLCARNEELIISECKYEKDTFLASLINMVNYVWREKRVIMVLHRLNMAQKSTIEFLKDFIVKKSNNISILSAYSEIGNDAEYMRQIWDEFVREIEIGNMLAECGVDNGSVDEKYVDFKDDDESVEQYITGISNMNYMTAFDEAAYYVGRLYHKLIGENTDISEHNKKRICMLYAYVALCSGDTKTAFIMCKNLKNMMDFSEDLESKYLYNYLTALIKGNDRQGEQAKKNVEICKKIAEQTGNKYRMLKAEMLRCIVSGGGWKDVLTWQIRISVSKEFLDEMEKRHQYNHLSYIYFMGFNYIDEIDDEVVANLYDRHPYFKKALKMAEELGNTRSVFLAWQRLIVLYTANGKWDRVGEYYRHCLDISIKNNQKEEIAELYHGEGYANLVVGKHNHADVYFKKAIDILIQTKNPSLILETIYNMSLNAIDIEQYEDVVYYIGYTLRMMKILKKERLRVCNVSKLYGLLTVAYIKIGKLYDAKLYLDKIKLVLRHILKADGEPDYLYWEDDVFLYHMIEGMISMREGDYDKARKMYERDIEFLKTTSGKQDYILPLFISEVSDLYKKTGEMDKWKMLLDDTVDYIKKRGGNFQIARIEKLREGRKISWSDEHKPIERLSSNTMQDIYEIVTKSGMQIEIDDKNKALIFFENWVDLINTENMSLEQIAENAMLTMQNIYSLDGILWIDDDGNGKPKIRYKSSKINVSCEQILDIMSFFNERRKRIVVKRSEKAFEDNNEFLEIFGMNNISSFVGIPIISNSRITSVLITFREKRLNFIMNDSVLTESDSDIMRAAFRQLIDAENREKFRLSLEKNSITDSLTGLYNRQGFKKYLDGCFKNKSAKKNVFTVLYIDLDNFKYCNDRFGHDVGDAVLVAFSDMLKDILGDKGAIIRYGGDEFVIIVPDVDENEGVNIAKNVFEIINQNKGFEKDIECAYGKKVSLEKSNRVSCSIGIASGKCNTSSDVMNILSEADKLLYEVKKTTKHNYRVKI